MTNDFANPYKNTTVNQPSPKSTSHKWFGADTVPAAGALPPIDTRASGLNKTGFAGNLSCARCHSVHGTSGEDSTKAPYLRMANDQDQMCRNCHRTRDITDHKLGSHPVNISYTSASAKAKIAAGTLLATPAQVQTAIPGKYSKVKLVNGKVVCSTCHGTHGTDSRSSTFDIVTSLTFRPLSASRGYLLRVDAYGKTVNDLNICTNCHAQKKNHNLGGKNGTTPVQCNDCHSGHVEYDPAAVGDELIKNNNLVRRYLQYSTAGRPSKRVFYRYTGATTKEYYNAAKKGVCQSCHNPPNDHYVGGTPAGAFPDAGHLNCNSCHTHTETSGSFSYGVGSNCLSACHGYPPVNNNTSGPGSRTAGYIGYDETTTPHASHSGGGTSYYNFVCNQCHKGYTMPQSPSTTQSFYREVFINTTGAGIYSGATATYSATLTTSPSTCNNVYCHSRGNGTWKAGQNNVQWGNNTINTIIGLAGATRCNTCHDTAMATGAHARHLLGGFGYGCVNCHDTTVSDNTTLRDAAKQQVGSHVNGIKNVEFNDVSPAVGTTCANIACHSNGKGAAPIQVPVWGTPTTGQCGDCHQTKQFGNISSAAHNVSAHLSTAVDDQCVRCHSYNGETAAPHVDGTINVNYGGTGCAINACHGTITAPTWTAAYTGKDTCTKCHGTLSTTAELTANRYLMAPSLPAGTDTGNVSADPKTGAHQTHLRYLNGFSNYSTVDYRCRSCHGITLPASGTHANGSSTPSFQYMATKNGGVTPVWTAASLTCSSTYCHNPAGTGGSLNTGNVGTRTFVSWTAATYLGNTAKTTTNCNRCHKAPGDNAGDILLSGSSTHSSVKISDSCSGCHGHNGDTAGALGQRHMDGKLYGSGSCNTCHGYPPVANTTGLNLPGNFLHARIETFNGGYAGGGGYHEKHLLATIVESDGFTPCLPCHPSTSHQQGGTVSRANVQVNDAADTGYRFDGARSKRYNLTTWSCSNVSCHFRPTPPWNI